MRGFWGALEGFLGLLGGPREASWTSFGGLRGLLGAILLPFAVSLNGRVPIWSVWGGVLGPSWAVLGFSLGLLGRLGALLGRLDAFLASLGAVLGASRAVSDARKTEEPTIRKLSKNHRKTIVFYVSKAFGSVI